MGVKLAQQAGSIYWLGMIPSYADRLVLQRMALQALDTPGESGQPPHVYYAGREALMLALSDGTLPEPGTPGYDTQARKVRACLSRLIKAGAVERIDTGRKGHRSTYKLTLGGSWLGGS